MNDGINKEKRFGPSLLSVRLRNSLLVLASCIIASLIAQPIGLRRAYAGPAQSQGRCQAIWQAGPLSAETQVDDRRGGETNRDVNNHAVKGDGETNRHFKKGEIKKGGLKDGEPKAGSEAALSPNSQARRSRLRQQAEQDIERILKPEFTNSNFTEGEVIDLTLRLIALLNRGLSVPHIESLMAQPPSIIFSGPELLKSRRDDSDMMLSPKVAFDLAITTTKQVLFDLEAFAEKVEWPQFLRAVIILGDTLTPQQVEFAIQLLGREVTRENLSWREDIEWLQDYEVSAMEMAGDFRALLRRSPNYQVVRQILSNTGRLEVFEEILGGTLPEQVSEARLATAMSDKGPQPTFKNLATGEQLNGLHNPFALFLGKKISEIPLTTIQAQLPTINESLPTALRVPNIVELRVYHRTDSPEQARQIAQGQALVSMGRESAIGGSAVWGKGTYLGFSDQLYQYGPFVVELKLNPNAIIGKDLDIFVGQGDGYIAVAKNSNAFVPQSGRLLNMVNPPPWTEPAKNHLLWLAQQIANMKKEQRQQYWARFFEAFSPERDWGPWELWLFVHLEPDAALRTHLDEQVQSLFVRYHEQMQRAQLKMPPHMLLEQVSGHLRSKEDFFESVQSEPLVVGQLRRSPYVLHSLPWLKVPETSIRGLAHFVENNGTWYGVALGVNGGPLNLLMKKESSRLAELTKDLGNHDYRSLADARLVYVAFHLHELRHQFVRIEQELGIVERRPKGVILTLDRILQGQIHSRLMELDLKRFRKTPEFEVYADFVRKYQSEHAVPGMPPQNDAYFIQSLRDFLRGHNN